MFDDSADAGGERALWLASAPPSGSTVPAKTKDAKDQNKVKPE